MTGLGALVLVRPPVGEIRGQPHELEATMDEFVLTAHAKSAAVDWYDRRARVFRRAAEAGSHAVIRIEDDIASLIDVAWVAKLLTRAAISEQIPQILREDAA